MQPIAYSASGDHGSISPAEVARRVLEREILPFWLESGIDTERGGFFTCFDNYGTTLVSTDKYSWSQGRFVAILAWAARLARRGLLTGDPDKLVGAATAGAYFLRKFVLDGRATRYVVTRDGSPVTDGRADQRSIYSDCFVAMGFAELAATSGDSQWLALGRELLTGATEKVLNGDPPTAPYALPAGVRSFGPRMILVNAETVLCRAASALYGGQASEQLTELSSRLSDLSSMARSDGRYDEVRFGDQRDETTLLGRHQTPGHALEGLWMQAEARSVLGADPGIDGLVRSAGAICESGWDTEFGGLLRYIDRRGGAPTGDATGTDYESLVRRTWDTKLWWVHAEACYCLTMLVERGNDPLLKEWRDRVWNYTFSTFPEPEQGPEWIQIRERDGSISDQVVALPLKDPYHITRSMMQLIELGATEGTQQS